ncbi:IMPACT family protein [Methylomonas sp. MED-D]|uniref:IMPACT family protein n=1 Tax=unclassified Methylomonas TaxID=2608980 RepID=UPI0028A42B55|nr:YigZ family protein [Methylomonas sp. MV1]MDT4331997.1 YigZ family protein [Methylomonas sp. MV1]
MKTVAAEWAVEELIKKSRFIGVVCPCSRERDALLFIERLRVQHSGASHVAFAYRVLGADGLIGRCNDAGEPSGTAGKPIFQHLDGKQLINLCVAVVRYYGGVKLGAGGLTRAYGSLAKQVIDAAQIVEHIEFAECELSLDYSRLQMLDYHLKKLDGVIVHQDFADSVTLRVKLPKHQLAALQALIRI